MKKVPVAYEALDGSIWANKTACANIDLRFRIGDILGSKEVEDLDLNCIDDSTSFGDKIEALIRTVPKELARAISIYLKDQR